jgi:hypothetical protein
MTGANPSRLKKEKEAFHAKAIDVVHGDRCTTLPAWRSPGRDDLHTAVGDGVALRPLCGEPLLLSRRLLPQAHTQPSMSGKPLVRRRLLPQTDAVHPLSGESVVSRRLLPQANAESMLANRQAVLSLSAA